jgi:RNA polymerase sigma-70 factor (ECF subfamily)
MKFLFSKSSACKYKTIEQLYTKYRNLMYHVAYDILKDHQLAEDAVQSAFVKLSSIKFYIDDICCKKTRSFMIIIIRSVSFTIFNKEKKENKDKVFIDDEELENVSDDQLSPIDYVIGNEGIEQVQEKLKTMDKKYSDVIIMRFFLDYSISEIASLFDISEQLVRIRIYRAKKMLNNKLYEVQCQ